MNWEPVHRMIKQSRLVDLSYVLQAHCYTGDTTKSLAHSSVFLANVTFSYGLDAEPTQTFALVS